MAQIDYVYNGILETVLRTGIEKRGRTKETFLSVPGMMLRYEMRHGFPLLTTKRIATKTMLTELEGFLHGITSKAWYQQRGCRIWDSWANPTKAPYGHTKEAKEAMKKEDDLGPIYGAQWRNFKDPKTLLYPGGVDQLKEIIHTLKTDSGSRRMVCSAWNPLAMPSMALPPCHILWQVLCDNDGSLHLIWYQRSVDVPVGLPFDIGHYAMLLTLLAKECDKRPGTLVGQLGDTHIYSNQITMVDEQLGRTPLPAPQFTFKRWNGIFDWKAEDCEFSDYQYHPAIPYPVAV